MDENTTKKIQELKNKTKILDALLFEPVKEKRKIYKALELIGSEIAKIKETQKFQNPEIEEIAVKLEQVRDMVKEIPAEFPEEVKVSNLKDLPPPQVKVETKEVRVSNLHELPRPKVEVPENLKEFNFRTLIKILENGFLGMVKQLTQKVTLSHRKPEEYIPVRLSDGKLFYEAIGGSGGTAGGPAVPTVWESGSKTVTTAGVPEVLASDTKCQSVTIKAKSTNTGVIKVGGLTGPPAFELAAGEQISGDIDNLNKIRIDATVNGEGVTYLYVW